MPADTLSPEELSTLLQLVEPSPLEIEPFWPTEVVAPSTPILVETHHRQSGSDVDASPLVGFVLVKQARERSLAARRCSTYRNKKRREETELRALSKQLEGRLAALVTRREALRNQPGYFKVAGWRGVALRQLKRRIEAETLNGQLRAQIRLHRSLAQDLVNVMHVCLHTTEAQFAPVKPETPKLRVHVQETDLRRVAAFTNDLDDMFEQTDDVFRNYGDLLPTATGAVYISQFDRQWDEEAQSHYMELVEATVVAFPLQEAAGVVLDSLLTVFGRECTPTIISLPAARSPLAYKTAFQVDGAVCQCVGVVQRFEQKDRAVLVWRAFIEEVNADSSAKPQYIESGWCVAQEQTSAALDGSSATVFRYCTRIQPLHPSTVNAGGSDKLPVDAYIAKVIQSGEDDALMLVQAGEDALLSSGGAGRTLS